MTATSRSWSAPASFASAGDALEAHRDEIYAWARRIVANHEDALDVVQDVCLRSIDQWAQGPPGHVRGWLRRVTVNRAIDLARSRASGKVRRATPSPAPAVTDDPERRRELIEAVQGLSEQQRHVLLAKVLDGLAFAQIAAEMDVAIPTVKTHYLRAVRALRERLAPALGADPP